MTSLANKNASNHGAAKLNAKSIVWPLVLPVPVGFAAMLVAVWFFLPPLVADNARENAVQAATQTVNQFKTIRGYYTKNVIKKAVKNGNLKPSFNHKTEANSIPLPATLIHDLSALLAKEDTTIDLYSAYPFPLRKDRQMDPFQREAWQYLVQNPDGVFTRQETQNGKDVVRVAIADRMVAQGCVNCHNSHAASPKTDWKLGDVRGVLEVGTTIDAQLASGSRLTNTIMIAAVIGGIILALFGFFSARRASSPLLRMTQSMKQLASGDNETDIPYRERVDEVGAMAQAVQVFKENAIEREGLAVKQAAEQEAKDRRTATIETLIGEFDSGVAGMLDAVGAASGEMETNATSMSDIADQTSEKATAVANASEEALGSVQAVAAATEELSSSVGEIGRQVALSTDTSKQAVDAAEHAAATVRGLDEAAQRIGEIVNMINDIAEQTNLLALNATIEAARAGEAGKGFAVVASEVKTLASQTAKMTDEIASQIGAIQEVSSDTVSAIDRIGQVIGEINEVSTDIASAIEQQGDATREIARNAQQAAQGTNNVSENITGVQAAAAETGTSSGQVLSALGELSMEADKLRNEVDSFLKGLRAA